MLSFAEELLVLLIDEDGGDLVSIPDRTLNYALAGAALLELGLAYRINTDATSLTIVDPTPLGDDLLDPVLADLVRETAERAESVRTESVPWSAPPEFWVRQVAGNAEDLRVRATERLVAQGILEADDTGLLGLSRLVSRSRRYTTADGEIEQEIRLRMMRILFGNELPGPRDAALISLVNACEVFQRILTHEEYEEVREKIDLYARLDRLGRAVANAIRVVTVADSQAMRRVLRKRGGGWPKVSGLPLLGNSLQMRKDLIGFITEQHLKLGPVFELNAFKRKMIVLAGPEANLFLLREGKNHFRNRDQWLGFNTELGAVHALISMDGADHTELRRHMRAGYSRGLAERRVADADAILAREIGRLPEGQPVPVFDTFQHVITEQIGQMSGGMSSDAYRRDMITFMDSLIMVHLVRVYPRFMMRRPKVQRARRRVNAFFEEVIAAHEPELRRDAPNRNLVDDLLEVHRSNPNLMSETDMWFSIMGPFIVGMHTVAATVSYILYSLIRHPEVMARVQVEADQLFAESPPTSEGVRNSTDALNATLETMRLYPIVPGITRQVSNSFDFAGYRIPAGANLLIATPVTNFLPEIHPEPYRFDIDRFSTEGRRAHGRPGIYAPFGLGSHSCLGQGFAQVLMPLTIMGLLHRWEITLAPPDYQIKTNYTPLPRPENRFKIQMRSRS